MGLRIRTNVQSLTAQRHMGLSNQKVSSHMEKLSSGYRINKAADDAAGLAISDGLNADIRSLAQARRNANDAVSMLQVAEGSLEEVTGIVTRLKELSVQAASDTVGGQEREYLNREFMQLKDEVDRIVLSTEFNGTRLLIGNGDVDPALLESQNQFPLEMQIGKDYLTPPDSLESRNPVNIIRLDFSKMNAATEGENSLDLGSAANEAGTRIDTKVDAQHSMARVDAALNKVADYRATIGAAQNRLGSTERNLGVAIENLSAARSRIRDADFAYETAEFTQGNILLQAGSSVLAQANKLPQVALGLLQSMG
ncbi:flagellin N-terminal helical domain-containing protein [Oligoflexus tunisiensis]|uniref:flagellin N-terminal helical domain-containing protein n=1 Tax=Oligoflexus tunisiensis TaxID=708132 RepID=UPI000A7FBB35|nr:flagellin [Oligoflexus tunisiensis]